MDLTLGRISAKTKASRTNSEGRQGQISARDIKSADLSASPIAWPTDAERSAYPECTRRGRNSPTCQGRPSRDLGGT